MNPYVKSVQPKDDYCLWLTFENGGIDLSYDTLYLVGAN